MIEKMMDVFQRLSGKEFKLGEIRLKDDTNILEISINRVRVARQNFINVAPDIINKSNWDMKKLKD